MPPQNSQQPSEIEVDLTVNGRPHALRLDTRTTLLDALREHLHLTGTKKGCDHGQCGACTVIVEGRRINSCLTLAVMHDGEAITTIEGLGTPEALHPLQAAFVRRDGFQCGYCTPGARLITGGTNLLDLMKLEIEAPAHLIDLRALQLDRIETTAGGGLRIGAMVTNTALASDATACSGVAARS